MTVYIVTLQQWDDVEILGVFDNIQKAADFVTTLPASDRINTTISTHEVQ